MLPPRPVTVGTGIAGLWTAWRLASEGQATVLVTKETLADSASAWAQGGIAAALGPGDSPSQHAADTLAASDGLADPEAVRILTSEGPDRIYELLALGARFDRGPDGRLGFGLEAAHTRARIIHAGGDRTGAALIGCLAQVVRQHPLIELLEHTEVTHLLVHDGRLRGVKALPSGGESYPIHTSAVVLATSSTPGATCCRWRPRCTTRWAAFKPISKDAPACPGSGRWERWRRPVSTARTASPPTRSWKVWCSRTAPAARWPRRSRTRRRAAQMTPPGAWPTREPAPRRRERPKTKRASPTPVPTTPARPSAATCGRS